MANAARPSAPPEITDKVGNDELEALIDRGLK